MLIKGYSASLFGISRPAIARVTCWQSMSFAEFSESCGRQTRCGIGLLAGHSAERASLAPTGREAGPTLNCC
jgi:hypothetical protein